MPTGTTRPTHGLQHDREGKPMLVLANGGEGSVHFDITHDDLQKLVLAMVWEQLRRGVTIRSAQLDL